MSGPASVESRRFEKQSLSGPIAVVVVTFVLLLPFVAKLFHIDDTVFVRVAEQILEDPLHP